MAMANDLYGQAGKNASGRRRERPEESQVEDLDSDSDNLEAGSAEEEERRIPAHKKLKGHPRALAPSFGQEGRYQGGESLGGRGRVSPQPEGRRPHVLGPRMEACKLDRFAERAKRLALIKLITPVGEGIAEMAMKMFKVPLIRKEAGLCVEDLENTDQDEMLFTVKVALRRIVDKHGDDWLPEMRPSDKNEFVYFVERLRARVASAESELLDRKGCTGQSPTWQSLTDRPMGGSQKDAAKVDQAACARAMQLSGVAVLQAQHDRTVRRGDARHRSRTSRSVRRNAALHLKQWPGLRPRCASGRGAGAHKSSSDERRGIHTGIKPAA